MADIALISLGINTREFESGADRTERRLSQLADKFNSASRLAEGFGRSLGGPLGAGLGDAARFFDTMNAKFSDFSRGLGQLGRSGSGLGGLSDGFGKASVGANDLGAALGGITRLSGGAVAALGATTAGVGLLASGAAFATKSLLDAAVAGGKYADGLSDLASQLDVSVGFLEKLDVAYTASGGSAEQARSAISKFSATIGEAASGNAPKLVSALKALGVEPVKAAQDFEGAMRNTLDTLSLAADRTAANALAIRLFGREGIRAVAINRDLADSSSELNQQLQRFGLLAGGEAIGSASKLGGQMDVLERKFLTMQVVIASRLAPSLSQLGDTFLDAFVRVEPAITRTAELLGGLVSQTSKAIALMAGLPSAFPDFAGRPVRGAQFNLTDEQKDLKSRVEGSLKAKGIDVDFDPTRVPEAFRKNIEASLNKEAIADTISKAIKDALKGLSEKTGGAGGGRGAGSSSSLHFGVGINDFIAAERDLAQKRLQTQLEFNKQSVDAQRALHAASVINETQLVDTLQSLERKRIQITIGGLEDELKRLDVAFAGLRPGSLAYFENLRRQQAILEELKGPLAELNNKSLPQVVDWMKKISLAVPGPPPGIVDGRFPGQPQSNPPAPPSLSPFRRGVIDSLRDTNEIGIDFGRNLTRSVEDALRNGFRNGARDGLASLLDGFSLTLEQMAVDLATSQIFKLLGLTKGSGRDFGVGGLGSIFRTPDFNPGAGKLPTGILDREGLFRAAGLGGLAHNEQHNFFKGIEDGFSKAAHAAGGFFSSLGVGFVDTIASLFKGKIFNPIGDFFGGLFGAAFGGFRAGGGPVYPGSLYMVGEKGPELFATRQAGFIMNQQQLAAGAGVGGGGHVNVTVNFSGIRDIQGFKQNSNEINRQIAAAVQQGQRMQGAR